MSNMSQIEKLDSKFGTYKFLRKKELATATHPGTNAGPFYHNLDTYPNGISYVFMAYETNDDAVADGWPAQPDMEPLPATDPYDNGASAAVKQVYFAQNRAITDRANIIQKVKSGSNEILSLIRAGIRANSFLNPYIGSLDLENMTLHQILVRFFYGRVLVFTIADKQEYKLFMSRAFKLNPNDPTRASLQLETFLGQSNDYVAYATSQNFVMRSEEILECLKHNFTADPLIAIYYNQQKISNGSSTPAQIIAAVQLGIINLDDDNSWRTISSHVNPFANNVITTDDDSDDSSSGAANAVKSTNKKKNKKNKTKSNSIAVKSSLPFNHPEAYCNNPDHNKNGKLANHSNQACLKNIMLDLRNEWYSNHPHAKMDSATDKSLYDEGAIKSKNFPAPR